MPTLAQGSDEMESKIDWSKAPEGCIGVFTPKLSIGRIGSIGFRSFFVITKRYSDYGAQAGCSGQDSEGKEYHVFEKYWDYHEKPASWSGEGLPPVGTVCELNVNGEDWLRAIIKYQGKGIFVWLWDHQSIAQPEYSKDPSLVKFRPIRTHEQIAADEREAAILDMERICRIGDFGSGGLAALYDAGYRKP